MFFKKRFLYLIVLVDESRSSLKKRVIYINHGAAVTWDARVFPGTGRPPATKLLHLKGESRDPPRYSPMLSARKSIPKKKSAMEARCYPHENHRCDSRVAIPKKNEKEMKTWHFRQNVSQCQGAAMTYHSIPFVWWGKGFTIPVWIASSFWTSEDFGLHSITKFVRLHPVPWTRVYKWGTLTIPNP